MSGYHLTFDGKDGNEWGEVGWMIWYRHVVLN